MLTKESCVWLTVKDLKINEFSDQTRWFASRYVWDTDAKEKKQSSQRFNDTFDGFIRGVFEIVFKNTQKTLRLMNSLWISWLNLVCTWRFCCLELHELISPNSQVSVQYYQPIFISFKYVFALFSFLLCILILIWINLHLLLIFSSPFLSSGDQLGGRRG